MAVGAREHLARLTVARLPLPSVGSAKSTMTPIPFRGSAPASLKNALVVDADPQVESVLGAALDPRRWMIQHAADNAQATSLVQASIYELVITSEKASVKEDVALLHRLRGDHPHTKLIILTDDSIPFDDPIRNNAYDYEQDLRPSRYGVLLERHFVDELTYNEKANNAVLIKRLVARSE